LIDEDVFPSKVSINKIYIRMLIPVLLFIFAFSLRYYYFTGFILGDDVQEFAASNYIINNYPVLTDPFHLRFGVWIFNVIFFKLLGVSEFSFFLPTFLMSSSLVVVGYYILAQKYTWKESILASIFLASAPFEILIGVVRANDLIFTWLLALGFLSLIYFEKMPYIQGILVAFFLWFAFYVKLWVVFLFPVIGIYYLYEIVKNRNWQGAKSFIIYSILLHGITGIIWKIKIGMFFPFTKYHSATYPVPQEEILNIFKIYPRWIFEGSEFGTTLFGYIPYLLLVLLSAKIILLKYSKKLSKTLRFDKLDVYLLAFYCSFFLLLNFFPNTFKFDQYYSAPRIFRYLAPISFPMTLHLAKLISDFSRLLLDNTKFHSETLIKKYAIIILFLLLISVNIYQADEATKPGQIYRRNLFSIIDDVKEKSPPQLISESWLNFFLREVYLKKPEYNISIIPIYNTHAARDYEIWLAQNQNNLKEGTMMITGLGGYLHYGCHGCGPRLEQFDDDLDPGWKLYREYETLSYLPTPEPARLWVWEPQKISD
jgi:hypothetical protein